MTEAPQETFEGPAPRLRTRYGPDLSREELEIRLAALRLDRRTMVEVFGWDPEARGL